MTHGGPAVYGFLNKNLKAPTAPPPKRGHPAHAPPPPPAVDRQSPSACGLDLGLRANVAFGRFDATPECHAHHITLYLVQHPAQTKRRNLSNLSQPSSNVPRNMMHLPLSVPRSLCTKPLATPFEPLLQRRVRKG